MSVSREEADGSPLPGAETWLGTLAARPPQQVAPSCTDAGFRQRCFPGRRPMDCSPPGSSVRAISQARILERVAIPFRRGSSQARNETPVSCVCYSGTQILYH